MSDKHHKYLFIHIPKTAGVKIRRNLHMNANYPHTRLCIPEEGDDLRYKTDAELEACDIVSGHFGFALRRRLPESRRCLTVLRRPLDRIVSGYYYWRTLITSLIGRPANALSLYEFAASTDPTVIEHIDNAQTWQLFWDFDMGTRTRNAAKDPAEVLAAARRNLASCDVVGLQEDLAGTLAKMKAKFAWEWVEDPRAKVNPTSPYDRAAVDEGRLREALGARIALDEDLYRYATELFARA